MEGSEIREAIRVQGENLERWQTLCQQAAVEQDTETLFKLIQEITTLLDEKQQRLHKLKTSHPA